MGINVMVSYFWILKVIAVAIMGYIFWDIFKSKSMSKAKGLLYGFIIVVILTASQSVRLVPDTQEVNARANAIIERQKILPDKITDSSFDEAYKNLKGISKEELK